METALRVGLTGRKEITVTCDMMASSIGSGHVYVYATAMMIAGMEATAPVSGTLRNTGRTAEITQVDCEAASGVLSQTQAVTLAPGETLDYNFDMPIENHSVNRYSIKLHFADGTESTVLTADVSTEVPPENAAAAITHASSTTTAASRILKAVLLKKLRILLLYADGQKQRAEYRC